MQAGDRDRFFAVMNGMAKVYEREIDPVLLDAYWLALRAWSLEEFQAAAGELMRTAKFMPRPSEFNELRKKVETRTASEAWFTSGRSDDPRANRAMQIAAQGRYVGHIPLDELPFVQRRFAEVYAELRDVEETRAALTGGGWLQISAETAQRGLVKLGN